MSSDLVLLSSALVPFGDLVTTFVEPFVNIAEGASTLLGLIA